MSRGSDCSFLALKYFRKLELIRDVKLRQNCFLKALAAAAIKSCMFGTRSKSKPEIQRLLPREEPSEPEVSMDEIS